MSTPDGPSGHVLQELGFASGADGDELVGSASITPEMWVPGRPALRTSILAVWTDSLAGWQAVDHIGPRVPVTLQLDVHVYRPLDGVTTVHAATRRIKVGSTVVVTAVDFTDQDGRPLAVGTALFVPAPDPSLVMPPSMTQTPGSVAYGPLREPLATRAGCVRRGSGVAEVALRPDNLNASGTLNGGLIALVAEEAALSAAGTGMSLSTITLRYLRPVRVGPAVAVAITDADVAEVEVLDSGRGGARAALVTTRLFAAP